jgi:hypothetical protein
MNADDLDYVLMTPEERAVLNHRAAQCMERMGGGFASALALAYYILAAFPDLFERYRRIASELAESGQA